MLCDVHGVEPDAVTVTRSAGSSSAPPARHRCARCGLRHASREGLLELVEFMGLTDVLPD